VKFASRWALEPDVAVHLLNKLTANFLYLLIFLEKLASARPLADVLVFLILGTSKF